jgi:hypothetical protein
MNNLFEYKSFSKVHEEWNELKGDINKIYDWENR